MCFSVVPFNFYNSSNMYCHTWAGEAIIRGLNIYLRDIPWAWQSVTCRSLFAPLVNGFGDVLSPQVLHIPVLRLAQMRPRSRQAGITTSNFWIPASLHVTFQAFKTPGSKLEKTGRNRRRTDGAHAKGQKGKRLRSMRYLFLLFSWLDHKKLSWRHESVHTAYLLISGSFFDL